jgi:hypothetical protein
MEWLDILLPSNPFLHTMLSWWLHVIHAAMIVFVLVGWMRQRWMFAHRITVTAVWLSWAGLGWYVGHLGYCILTDYQWRLLKQMGITDLPQSYIEFLIQLVWNEDIPDRPLGLLAATLFLIVTLLSFGRWAWEKRTERKR